MECVCEDLWDDSEFHDNCGDQRGCTNCDDDPLGSWCVVTNPQCTTVERDEDGTSEYWAYCDPGNSIVTLYVIFHVYMIFKIT